MENKRLLFLFILLPFFLAFSSIEKKAEEISRPMPPKIGEMAPEISMLTVDRATTYRLSELKGKLVLVNFWASLVAPCRFENPNLVRAYQKYKEKQFSNGDGFEIFSVSLDTDLNSWKSAIDKDRLTWKHHVSDLKGYESQAAHDYGIRAIPYNFLVDGEGKVIAINLRGDDLGKTLDNYLK